MAKVYAAIAGFLAVAGALFMAFFKGGKAKEAEITSELLDTSKKSTDAANEAIIDGMKRQQAIKDENRPPDRSRNILQ